MILFFFGLRIGRVDSVIVAKSGAWMLFIGALSSVLALVTSTWAPRGFRPLALFAAASWVACFGLALKAVAALSGLR